jgi:WD40 repeat protein
MNLFRKVLWTECEGKVEPECVNFRKGEKLPPKEHDCPKCSGKVKQIFEINWTAIILTVIVLLIFIPIIWRFLLPREKDPESPKPPIPEKTSFPPPSSQAEFKEVFTAPDSLSTIASITISTDGTLVGRGSEDGKITLWNIETGKEITTLTGHEKAVTAIAISPDKKTLISGSEDGVIKLWDIEQEELQLRKTLSEHQNKITAIVISADNQFFVSGAKEKQVKIWDLATQELLKNLSVEKGVMSLAISSKEPITLVSGNYAGEINFWDQLDKKFNGEERKFVSKNKSAPQAVSISSDGQIIISSSCKDQVRFWDPQTREDSPIFTNDSTLVCSIAISADGKTIAGRTDKGTILLWDKDTQKVKGTIQPKLTESSPDSDQGLTAIAMSSDGQNIVSSFGKTLKVWQLTQ